MATTTKRIQILDGAGNQLFPRVTTSDLWDAGLSVKVFDPATNKIRAQFLPNSVDDIIAYDSAVSNNATITAPQEDNRHYINITSKLYYTTSKSLDTSNYVWDTGRSMTNEALYTSGGVLIRWTGTSTVKVDQQVASTTVVSAAGHAVDTLVPTEAAVRTAIDAATVASAKAVAWTQVANRPTANVSSIKGKDAQVSVLNTAATPAAATTGALQIQINKVNSATSADNATTATTANAVAWANVNNRPTANVSSLKGKDAQVSVLNTAATPAAATTGALQIQINKVNSATSADHATTANSATDATNATSALHVNFNNFCSNLKNGIKNVSAANYYAGCVDLAAYMTAVSAAGGSCDTLRSSFASTSTAGLVTVFDTGTVANVTSLLTNTNHGGFTKAGLVPSLDTFAHVVSELNASIAGKLGATQVATSAAEVAWANVKNRPTANVSSIKAKDTQVSVLNTATTPAAASQGALQIQINKVNSATSADNATTVTAVTWDKVTNRPTANVSSISPHNNGYIKFLTTVDGTTEGSTGALFASVGKVASATSADSAGIAAKANAVAWANVTNRPTANVSSLSPATNGYIKFYTAAGGTTEGTTGALYASVGKVASATSADNATTVTAVTWDKVTNRPTANVSSLKGKDTQVSVLNTAATPAAATTGALQIQINKVNSATSADNATTATGVAWTGVTNRPGPFVSSLKGKDTQVSVLNTAATPASATTGALQIQINKVNSATSADNATNAISAASATSALHLNFANFCSSLKAGIKGTSTAAELYAGCIGFEGYMTLTSSAAGDCSVIRTSLAVTSTAGIVAVCDINTVATVTSTLIGPGTGGFTKAGLVPSFDAFAHVASELQASINGKLGATQVATSAAEVAWANVKNRPTANVSSIKAKDTQVSVLNTANTPAAASQGALQIQINKVNSATSADNATTATGVAWTGVANRPTAFVSSIKPHDNGYIAFYTATNGTTAASTGALFASVGKVASATSADSAGVATTANGVAWGNVTNKTTLTAAQHISNTNATGLINASLFNSKIRNAMTTTGTTSVIIGTGGATSTSLYIPSERAILAQCLFYSELSE